MLKAIWFLIKIAAIVALALWLAEQPGNVAIAWQDYNITGELGFFLLASLLFILVVLVIYRMILAIAALPGMIRNYLKQRRETAGHHALTLGLSAVAAGDAKHAAQHAAKASKCLPRDEGLVLFLSAQAARLQGHDVEAQTKYLKLLDHKDTAFLGLRGLLQNALDDHDYRQALDFSTQALKLHPKQPWILRMTYDLQIQQRLWAGALATLNKAEKAGAFEMRQVQSDRSAILMALVEQNILESQVDEAFQAVKQANRHDPLFLPAALWLASYYIDHKKRHKAIDLLERAWRNMPHPQIYAQWLRLAPNRARIKWIERLYKLNPTHFESELAMAEAYMQERLWGEARLHLQNAEKAQPSARVYRLWAQLEAQSKGDEVAEKHWLEKAADAPASWAWTCTQSGKIYENWAPLAMPHGSFNTIVWDVPSVIRKAQNVALPPGQNFHDMILEPPRLRA